MLALQSLRDMIDRGVELRHYEAVAIAQQVIALFNADETSEPRLGPPSLDNVRLGPDGSIVCSACATSPAVSEIAILLRAMLPRGGTTRVPGALRYTIARALHEVEAPPFGSLGDLSSALMRQERLDRSVVLRGLYARAAATAPNVVAMNRDRRRRAPSVSDLRLQLRDADEALFLLLNAAAPPDNEGLVPVTNTRCEAVLSAAGSDRPQLSRTGARALAVGCALLGLLMAGATTMRRSNSTSLLMLPPLPPSPLSGQRAEVLAAVSVEPRGTDLGFGGAAGGIPSTARVTTAARAHTSMHAPGADVGPAEQEMQIARKKIDLGLYDQALVTLRDVEARHPNAAAYFLIASIQETQGRLEDALATYLDIASRFPNHARAPEAMFRMAQCILRSRRPSRTIDARTLFGELAARYPASPWAPRALIARAELEERDRLHERDNVLATSVPTSLVTYRQVAEQYPASPERATALGKLGQLYEGVKRYDRAAETFTELAKQYPRSEYDAWFKAAEIYDRRLKDPDRARADYQRVPPTSPHFSEAQKRLRK
jgi:TolA-binding protein